MGEYRENLAKLLLVEFKIQVVITIKFVNKNGRI